MATPEEVRKLREEYERLNRELKNLTGSAFKDMSNEPKLAAKQLQTLKTSLNSAKREAAGLSGIFGDLRKNLQANISELDKASTSINTGKRAYRELVKVVRELSDEEAGINRLSFQQLKKLKARNQSSLKEMRLAAERLAVEQGIGDVLDETSQTFLDLGENEQALLRARNDNFATEQRAVKFTGFRLDLERKVLDTLKLSGGALQGIGNLASSLGLQGFAESLDEIKGDLDNDLRKSIRKAAEAQFIAESDQGAEYSRQLKLQTKYSAVLVRLQEKRAQQGGYLSEQDQNAVKLAERKVSEAEEVLEANEDNIQALYGQVSATETLLAKTKALKKAAFEFGKQLTDPVFFIGSMVKGFVELDEKAVEFQRLTGQNVRALANQNNQWYLVPKLWK